jgi:photosystem II stability/assembly factor-like uncharacterized protein
MTRRLLLLAAVTAAVLPQADRVAAQNANPIVTTLALFAGTPSGLRLSRDWGTTWDRRDPAAKDGLETVGAVRVILPLGPTVYVGGEGGLFQSDDYGRTWERLGVLGSVQCILLSRYFNVDPTIFVGTGDGLLKSEDAGQSFHATALRGTPVTRLDWPGPALVAATGRGVVVSTNAGASFGPPGEGLPDGGVRALALSSFYPVDPVLFAGAGSHGVFRSRDGARTWTSAGLEDQVVTDLAWLGPFLYAVTDRGLYRSQDMGRLWTPLGDGLNGVSLLRIFFPAAPSGAEAFLATERGIYRTPDGGQHWLPTGFKDEPVLTLGAFPAPSTVVKGKKK